MATRTRPAPRELTQEDIAEIQQQMEIHKEEEETPEDIAYKNLLSEMGIEGSFVDARVYVHKLNYDNEGNDARVWEGAPEDYDLARIAKKFGSGQYKIKLHSKNEAGYRVHRATRIEGILLENDKKEDTPMSVPSAPSVSLEDVRRTVIETMTMLQPKQPEPVNPMAMMMQLSEVMRNLMPQQTAPQIDQFGMFRQALDLVKSLQGDTEPIERGTNATTNDLLLGMLNKFGGPIAQALQQSQQQQLPMPVPMQPQSVPVHQAIPAQPLQQNPITQPQPAEDEMSLKLKMALNFVISACDAGGSPGTYAELALDQVPEAEITQLLSLPDPVAALAQFDSRVADDKHREWFKEMFEEIRELMKPEEDEKP